MKLPLSTTYVTFMVAMGSSLSDKAWGRDSAVYRITGVITVIGGWFFTAFSAFTAAAFVATILYFGGIYAIVAASLFAGYVLVKTHILHKDGEDDEDDFIIKEETNEHDALMASMKESRKLLNKISTLISKSISGLAEGDVDELKKLKSQNKKLKKRLTNNHTSILELIKLQSSDDIKQERRYGKLIVSLQMLQKNAGDVWESCYRHVDNNHSIPSDEILADLINLSDELNSIIKVATSILSDIENKDCKTINEVTSSLENKLQKYDKKHIVRMKDVNSSMRNNFLFLDLFSYFENISNHINSMINLYCKNYDNLD